MYRVIIAGLIFCVYCLALGIFLLEAINLQFIALGAVLLISIFKPGWRSTLKNLKILSPFIAMLIAVYGLFILFGISPQGTISHEYWLTYGLPRILLLVSSVLFFRICFSFVSIDDLIRSDISIRYLKYLILGKILYDAAFHSFPKIRFWQDLTPTMKNSPKGFRERFKRSLAATLALVLYTLNEAEQKGQKIDDLIRHCHKERS